MATKNFKTIYYPTSGEVFWLQDSNNLNIDKKCQIIAKWQVLTKNAKIHDGKNMKTIPLPLKTMQ